MSTNQDGKTSVCQCNSKPDIWYDAAVELPADPHEIKRIIEDLETAGVTVLNHYNNYGDAFIPWSEHQLRLSVITLSPIQVHKVIVEHTNPPRPDQTAFYDVCIRIKPTNERRKMLIEALRKLLEVQSDLNAIFTSRGRAIIPGDRLCFTTGESYSYTGSMWISTTPLV